MIWYEVFERGSILNPMIKSSFGRRGRAESLDCDLQRSFLAFFFLNLYETGRLVGARVALVPFPQVRWGSGKVVSLEDGPLLERSECSRWISKWLLFVSSCLSTGGFFSSPLWEPGRVPEGKNNESGWAYDWAPRCWFSVFLFSSCCEHGSKDSKLFTCQGIKLLFFMMEEE